MDSDYGLSESEDDFEVSSKAKGKSAAPPKKAPPKENHNQNSGSSGARKDVNYKKVTQLEHILLRPDTYIGSVESRTEKLWVYGENGMEFREITYVPGLYKIFDEILVNAADNFQRDKSMTAIRVKIDPENNYVEVYNDGQGIDIRIDEKEKIWIPDLIFGHLLTSSNYDDDEKKVTGGRNGYGAKLCNIFSTEFVVETVDSFRKKSYKQVFRSNMQSRSEPIIKDLKSGKEKDFVRISFRPDLAKFGMSHLDKDTVALLTKRVYDIAGCNSDLKVYFNDVKIPVSNFKQYVELYTKSDPSMKVVQETVNDRWAIAVTATDGEFRHCSFVNSIATIRGGSHVDYVLKPIINGVIEAVKKKDKKAIAVKPNQVRSHIWVFVRALIENPAFDSQTKETLTTKQTQFGSTCKPSEEFLKKVLKETGIVQATTAFAAFKAEKVLGKKDGKKTSRITGIPKLDDANLAGTRNSQQCTLILTEGDSAKTLAVSGLGIIGRDYYGVFPLRGKFLNVREATHKQLMENAELNNIKKILGLKSSVDYSDDKNFNTLRYGKLMIMTDQDHDGSHIKGLLINLFAVFWESLLRRPGFLVEFITPIVKVSKKGQKDLSFYTLTEYNSWKESHNDGKGFNIKYYKGLGTSSREEAREYFSNLSRHKIDFKFSGRSDIDAIQLAFDKGKANDRKEWIGNFEADTFLDQNVKEITYTDFVNKELIHFSVSDCRRSIPCLVDGLKPGHRKILFSCFKRNLKKDIKVAQLSGYVSENSAYHHGEQSLQSTIIGMAQNFIGSNNVNLLHPSGQFGSRLQGGKDHASPRYIFTRLSNITRSIFPEIDDKILKYLDDDGQSIEPEFYVPIIPMILINGAEGIGTGWSTSIPCYNMLDIIENIRNSLDGNLLQPMVPWYHGFNGTIEEDPKKPGSFTCTGIFELDESDLSIRITELPVGTWTQPYKEFLESKLMETGEKDAFITDIKEYHADTTVDFKVTFTEAGFREVAADPLKKLRLSSTINTTNMHVHTETGIISRFSSTLDIIERFIGIRKEFYRKRKNYQQEQLQNELERLENQARFILAVIKDEMKIRNVPRKKVLSQLEEQGYAKFTRGKVAKKVTSDADLIPEEGDEDAEKDAEEKSTGYEYLLSMNLWSLTEEKVKKLLALRDERRSELETLLKKTPEDLWREDLQVLEEEYAAFLRSFEEEEERTKKKPARKQLKHGDDSDDDFTIASKAKAKIPKAKIVPSKAIAVSTEPKKTLPSSKPALATKSAPAPKPLPAPKTALESKGDVSKKSTLITKYFTSETKESAQSRESEDLDFSAFDDMEETSVPAAKKTAKKNVFEDSDDDFDDSHSNKKDTIQVAKDKPKRSVAPKKIALDSDSDEDEVDLKLTAGKIDDDDFLLDEDEDEKPKPKIAPKAVEKSKVKTTLPAAKAAPKAASKPAPLKTTKPAPLKTTKPAPSKKKLISEDDDDFDDEVPKAKAVQPAEKAAPRRAAAAAAANTKKWILDSEDEDEGDDLMLDEEEVEVKKAPVKKDPPVKKALVKKDPPKPATKKRKADYDDDSEDSEEDYSESSAGESDDDFDDSPKKKPKKAPVKRAAPAKPPAKKLVKKSFDDDEEFDSGSPVKAKKK